MIIVTRLEVIQALAFVSHFVDIWIFTNDLLVFVAE
jgi:hypothetical protein